MFNWEQIPKIRKSSQNNTAWGRPESHTTNCMIFDVCPCSYVSFVPERTHNWTLGQVGKYTLIVWLSGKSLYCSVYSAQVLIGTRWRQIGET